MVHMFRSPHLDEVCPLCRKEHHGKLNKKNWGHEFWKHDHYLTLICGNCGYKIHKKTEHSHSGHY